MRKFKLLLLTLSVFIISTKLYSTHIIGGYLDYECVGPITNSNQVAYNVTLHLYVDCGENSADNPSNARASIFNEFDVFERGFTLNRIKIDLIPDGTFNPCVVNDTTICAIEETYTATINLPADESSKIVYQRCCRNDIIDNIPSPDNQGVTYELDIPIYTTLQSCNNTPVFSAPPPLSFCKDYDININISALDPDLDSLVYSVCAPLNYNDTNIAEPTQALSPPYSEVPFLSPYSGSNPLPANPQLSIDPQSGILSGNPTQEGQYVIGICVEEYKNNVLINTVRRDIQIIVENCQPIVTTAVQEQEQFCNGFTVQFKNKSTSNDLDTMLYLWNFGDTTTLADTSRKKDPLYIYPDTGVYTITLITNPYFHCSDTSTEEYRVLPLLDPDIDYFGRLCEDSHSVHFAPGGSFEPYADFEWKFTNANISSSNQDTVYNVSFSGLKPEVQLVVSENGCTDTVNKTVQFFPNPIPNFSLDPSKGCYPLKVDFQNQSTPLSNANFEWNFGDGSTSTGINPSHIYLDNGYYDVSLTMQTTEKCIDTVTVSLDSAVYISLDSSKNQVDFILTPTIGCPPLKVNFTENATYEGNAEFYWDFGDGNTARGSTVSHTYYQSGDINVGLMMISTEKCVDTLIKVIDNAIYIEESPNALLVVSDSSKSIKNPIFIFDGKAGINYKSSHFLIHGERYEGDYLTHTFTDTGHHLVQQILINGKGCTDTTEVIVWVYDEFEFIIPNIFTPNSDGINDRFAPKATGVYDYEVEIFNRYGEKVFQSESLNIQWDGRIQGKKAQSGVYYYIIRIMDFTSTYKTYKGSLTLLREKLEEF